MHASRIDWATSVGLLILRVGMGGFMLSHGVGKLRMLIDGAGFADPIGIGETPSLCLVVFAEFGCSILVMLGLLTRCASIPLVITMLVAAFIAHAGDPFFTDTAAKAFFAGTSKSWASKQGALMFAVPFLALIFTGAGRFSIDAVIGRKRAAATPTA